MKDKLRVAKNYVLNNLELFLVPIFFLLFTYLIGLTWQYFNLPTQENLIEKIQSFFLAYGLIVIFLSSILESTLFLGWYFPGSLVIFLGVAATTGKPELAALTVLTVCSGMMLGYNLNYFLGKYGWHSLIVKLGFRDELLKIENRIINKGIFKSFFLYIMPSFGSLLSTAFGVLKYSYTKFFFFTGLMVIFWNTVWGVLVYFYGMEIFKILTNKIVFFVIFCIYFFYIYNKNKDKILEASNYEKANTK